MVNNQCLEVGVWKAICKLIVGSCYIRPIFILYSSYINPILILWNW